MSLMYYGKHDPQKHPCFNCKMRYATCHGECAKFKKYEKEKEKKRGKESKNI